MRNSRLSRAARKSLARIYDGIVAAAADEATADSFVVTLQAQCEKLASLPGTLGRPRPELGDDFRSFPYRGYVIVFRYLPEVLDIVDILSERQDIDAHFSEDEQ